MRSDATLLHDWIREPFSGLYGMSYPSLSDVVKALAGVAIPLPFGMFGIFVAMAALIASAVFRDELRRLYTEGRIGMARIVVRDKDDDIQEAAVPPHQVVDRLMLVVMVAGVAGARLFHILDHLDEFRANPWPLILSRSGLSVFGGLIIGAAAGMVYVRRMRLQILPTLDAAALGLMLGYAIGRIGCQVAGDGDWGIAADMALKPEWLPTWLWAQTYEYNIVGVSILAPGVYPTPVYETMMGLLCFVCLWVIRRHPFRAGWLFSVYLIAAGVERLAIEQIRINPVFELAGIHCSQAEGIAVALLAGGIIGTLILGSPRRDRTAAAGSW